MTTARAARPILRTLAAAAFASLVLVAGDEGGRTVWSGVYTDAQADRGAQAYQANCQSCHGAQLTGQGEAKPLSGAGFLSSWNGLSVGDLFERIRTTMPINAPKSLPRTTYADILAYLLKFNGFPAGAGELPAKAEMLADVRFDAFRSSSLGPAGAWAAAPAAAVAPNSQPNPYVADSGFLRMPPGRTMGSSSAVAVDSRGHIWVADRCGANSCAKSDLDPILEFDAQGRFVKAFGRGLFVFPHGMFVDSSDHIWVTDVFSAGGKGAQVFEFDRDGRVLRTLGKAGVAVAGRDTFAEPCGVAVARDGTIFVADGHTEGKDSARIVKFDASGRYLAEWGKRGPAPGQMEVPHGIALDSRGRVFVADRWNNRVDVFTPDGRLLHAWDQFGRPSGVYVDAHDTLYVTDSESRERDGYGHHPGWKRGIRIGSARTGQVLAFIPDANPAPETLATSGGEGVWADTHGVVYSAEVTEKAVVRYAIKGSSRGQ
jgi:sugar lactone lactonase YvrE/mono/diheme cytochrome c family protein